MGEPRTNNEPTETNRPNKGRFVRLDANQQETNKNQQTRDLGSNSNQQETNRVLEVPTDETNGPRSKTLLSPSGRVLPGVRTHVRLSGLKLAKAGQIQAILDRVESKNPELGPEAERLYALVQTAMESDHDPEELLLELVAFSRKVRGLPPELEGKELATVAAGLFP